MQTLILTDELRKWKPNITDIGDRLIMGPQRSVLEKVNNVNSIYGLNLGITRTYRWSPGYMDQIKEWMNHKYIEPHMKRKISTFFNQIDGKCWSYQNLRDKLNVIENELCNMRARRQVFQDNTEIVETVYTAFMERVTEELEGKDSYFNIYVAHNKIDASRYEFAEENIDKKYLVFMFYLPETVCNFYVGAIPYPIPIYETTLFYAIELDNLLYKISANLDWIEDKTKPILSRGNYNQSYSRQRAVTDSWRGIYHRNYINEADGTNHYGNDQLLHPYISNEEVRRSNTNLLDEDKGLHKHAYACMGGFLDSLTQDLKYLRLGHIYATLYNWHTVFNSTTTRPMNPIQNMFFGRHKFMDDTFANVINVSEDRCRIKSNSTSGPKTYCDEYECQYRKTCSYYNFDSEKHIMEDDDGLPANYREEADNIHGGEYVSDPEATIDEHNRIIAENQNLEEQMIAWASQRGGAINIANNNERNNDG